MVEREERAAHLLRIEGDTFVETLSALERLARVAEPHVDDLDRNPRFFQSIEKHREALGPELGAKLEATVEAAYGFVLGILSGRFTKRAIRSEPNGSDQTFQQDEPEREIDPLSLIEHEDLRDRISERMREREEAGHPAPDFRVLESGDTYRFVIADTQIASAFWSAVTELDADAVTPRHSEILRRSILTMAVSAFEQLLGAIHRAVLLSNVTALGNKDKIFSLDDLLRFGSVDDAIEETIENEVDSFTRRGASHWRSWLKRGPLGICMEDCSPDWNRTIEVFERRNVAIHNAGRVSKQYLKNVHDDVCEVHAEGQPLEVSNDYLEFAIENLLTLGVLLAFSTRMKLFSRFESDDATGWLIDKQYASLKDSRYACSSMISQVASSFDLPHDTELRIRVNGWIAMLSGQDLGSPVPDIVAWDTSALGPVFRLARHVLLGQDEAAIPLLERLVETQEVSLDDLADWPLFERLRREGKVGHLLAAAGIVRTGGDALQTVGSEGKQQDGPSSTDDNAANG